MNRISPSLLQSGAARAGALALAAGAAALTLAAGRQAFGQARAAAVPDEVLTASLTAEVAPILTQYCFPCHGGGNRRGRVDIEGFATASDVRAQAALWKRVSSAMADQRMPPTDMPQPTSQERDLVVEWIGQVLATAAPAAPAAARPAPVGSSPMEAEFFKTVQPVLEEFCYACHSDDNPRAGFDLTTFHTYESIKADRERWAKLRNLVMTSQMPTQRAEAQPTPAQRDLIVQWVARMLVETAPKAVISETSMTVPFDPEAKTQEDQLAKNVGPMLQEFCYSCHSGDEKRGGLALDGFKTLADIDAGRETWLKIHEYVKSSHMPPATSKQPTQFQRDYITAWLEAQLFKFDPANPDPGRVTIHRLNRAEYNNTIRDLIGVDFKPADDFPADDSGYGFDNIADVLSLPPLLMEKYLAAADKILDQAIVTDPIASRTKRVPANLAEVAFNALGDRGDGWIQLISLENDDVALEMDTVPGDYIFRVQAVANPGAGLMPGGGDNQFLKVEKPDPLQMTFMLGDTIAKIHDNVTSDIEKPDTYETRIGSPGGRARFRAVNHRIRGGDNENTMVNGKIGKQQDGMLLVKWLEIEGPLPAENIFYGPGQLIVDKTQGKFNEQQDWVQEKNGEAAIEIETPAEAEYIFRVEAYGQQAGPEAPKMELKVDGKAVQTFDVKATARLTPVPGMRLFSIVLLNEEPAFYEAKATLTPGKHRIAMAFTNDFSDPAHPNINYKERNLAIRSVQAVNLSRPVAVPEMPGPIADLFANPPLPKKSFLGGVFSRNKTDERDRAEAIVAEFAKRAWRRPVADDESERLMQLYDLARGRGDSFNAGVKLAMKATLISPHFLYRGGPAAAPQRTAGTRKPAAGISLMASEAKAVPAAADAARKTEQLSDYDLASRLSYFLWSSMPDKELFAAADRGSLRKELPAQVRRMLADPKSKALVDNFAGQWLEFRGLATFQPDKTLFPAFDEPLRDAMAKETAMFFESVMRENSSVLDFLSGDYTFVNAKLAAHYGMEGVEGEEFRRVSLVGTHRSGVITHGSVLLLTSNPTRTSPVKRGKWVLENLLGTPPPPPPPDIPELQNDGQPLAGTLREQMEAHRENPNCSSCHARMDPIGFGMENFDAVGKWRVKDGDFTIEPSGQLVSGESFAGATELSIILAKRKSDEFVRCLSEKLLTYALGRGLEYYDKAAVDQISAAVVAGDYKFDALMLAVAESFPFQNTREADPAAAEAEPEKQVAAAHGRLPGDSN